MAMEILKGGAVLILLSAAGPVLAQYVTTPSPAQTPPPAQMTSPAQTTPSVPASRPDEINISARKGQSTEQQWADRYDCHRWAREQSGFDPTQVKDAGSTDTAARRDQYRRAFTACMEARGYTVQYGAPPPPPPLPAARPPAAGSPPVSAARWTRSVSGPERHPFAFQIEGGYTLAAGSTRDLLEDGSNVGFGMTWFPVSALPIGLRLDGSYSTFHAKDAFLNMFGAPGYTSGHQNIYGGDADLQLDLAHRSSQFKLYLFGGAGWYREQTHLRQVSLVDGGYCDFYGYCWPGLVPVVTAVYRSTSPWRSAWNAGLGWEVALADNASFFVEARYERIAPRDSQMQFVPIRVGLRF